ncbi:MAG: hypothetical protein ACLUEQ_01270 [Cloacibacillus evryensis]
MKMFLKNEEAFEIVREFGSPVYVYSEDILRQRCRELIDAFDGRLSPSFSIKANSNISAEHNPRRGDRRRRDVSWRDICP